MDDLKIEYMSLSDIKPYRRNAKKHPAEQVEQIANSITQFGMNDPIAVMVDILLASKSTLTLYLSYALTISQRSRGKRIISFITSSQ